jgi:hypothetical protein
VALRWGTQNDRVYSTKVLTLRESGAHDAPCDPKVDSSFVDHPRQPHTHSLRILLKHGKKRDNFVIFVKRGHDATTAPYLTPNQCVDLWGDLIVMRLGARNDTGTTVVHMRGKKDTRLAKYVVQECV